MLASLLFWFLMASCVGAVVWLIAQAILFTLAQNLSDE
jgi:hypothetical protein